MSMDKQPVEEKHLWWQTGVVYQIYPLSFADSNGDGHGDLPGILGKLDYLKWLGVHAIWISPIYPSPLADYGYDVSDYKAINPLFGTMEDFDRLLAGCHERGIKLLLDYVPNHTSDQHPWFLEVAVVARQSQAELVPLEGGRPGRRGAEQLAERLRRAGLAVG